GRGGPCATRVLHWCGRWRLQDEDAADVFQEVFQAVARHIKSFRKQRAEDTFRGWLRTITRNKVHDHFRRLRQEPAGVGGSTAQWRLGQVPPPPPPPEEAPGHGAGAERHPCPRALRLNPA